MAHAPAPARLSRAPRPTLAALEDRSVPAVFTVSNLNDGDVTAAGQLPGSLRQAIFDANAAAGADTIVFSGAATAGTLTLTKGQLSITGPLAIDGPTGATLTVSGDNASRIFFISDDTVAGTSIVVGIDDLILTKGAAAGELGGAIFAADENLTLTRVTVSASAAASGAGIAVDGVGAKLTLVDCTISGNIASDTTSAAGVAGGGVYFYGTALTVTGGTISANSATGGSNPVLAGGGGLFFATDAATATVSITKTSITNNIGGGRGGGILGVPGAYGKLAAVTLTEATISGNKGHDPLVGGGYGGGGAYMLYMGKVTFDRCTISGNASAAGAGLNVSSPNGGSLVLLDSQVTGNISSDVSAAAFVDGGGVYFIGTKAEVIGSTLSKNTVSGGKYPNLAGGGGLYFTADSPTASLTISGSTITDNTAVRGGGFFGNSGGAGKGFAFSLVNSTVSGNLVSDINNGSPGGGGGYVLYAGPMLVSGSTIANNKAEGLPLAPDTAGGGLQLVMDPTSTGTTVVNSKFLNNFTTGRGGGLSVFVAAGPVLIDNSWFDNNKSDGSLGGGIDLGSAAMTATITNSSFTNNYSFAGGGGIMSQGGVITVRNTTVANNSTGDSFNGRGAGIGAFGFGAPTNSLIVQNSTIVNNTSASDNTVAVPPGAGGIYTSPGTAPDGPTVVIENSILSGNTAKSGTNTELRDLYSAAKGVTVISSLISVADTSGVVIDAATSKNNITGTTATPAGATAKLGTLGNHGGSGFSIPLLVGSPLINAGADAPTLTTDQRGYPRAVGGKVDIGAFEVQPPPTVALKVNGGANQRSNVTELTLTFSGIVSLPVAGVSLAKTVAGSPAGSVTLAIDTAASTPLQTVAKVTFSGSLTEAGSNSLVDGNYLLTLTAPLITDGSGQLLDGNGDGTGGDNYVSPPAPNLAGIFRIYGDANGDRTVDFNDFLQFRSAFGTAAGQAGYNPAFDFNGNGSVDFNDFLQFRSRFGTTLPV